MNELLGLAVSAHGGLERWSRIRSIDVSLIISGQLLEVKGFPEHQHTKVTIDADRPRTVMGALWRGGRAGNLYAWPRLDRVARRRPGDRGTERTARFLCRARSRYQMGSASASLFPRLRNLELSCDAVYFRSGRLRHPRDRFP